MIGWTDERDIGEAFEADDGKDALGITITRRSLHGKDAKHMDDAPVGMPTQVKLLFIREMNNFHRDTTALGARFGLAIFLSILIGIIFLDVGGTDSAEQVNIQSHFGALIMCMLMSST
jgi:hypothetical protein